MRIKKLEDAFKASESGSGMATVIVGYLEDLDIVKRENKYPCIVGVIPDSYLNNRDELLNYENILITCYAGLDWNKKTDDKLTIYDQLIEYCNSFIRKLNEVSYINITNPDRIKINFLDEGSSEFALFVKFDLQLNFWNNCLPPYAITSISGALKAKDGDVITYTSNTAMLALTYSWTLPTGASGTSTTESIVLTFDNTFSGGVLKCKAHNDFGYGTEKEITITLDV